MDTLSSGQGGGLAQVVERSIRIREAPGSIPGFSNFNTDICYFTVGPVCMRNI